MTVQSDLQKAIASCEAAKGSYSMMAESTEDQQAKQMFNGMKSDIDRHLQFLNDRLDYLSQNNQLNKQQ
ncbi:rubrerythrin [Anaerosolibacter carboniphilus]|uniref:Rubrerythrin n=1 Tax=Anaerosolibacter carboniphilus TaxID=1417629 RepID=A0A841KYT3_9FIRM|nr:DUF1657 domain-containing protein [Anaerosolibacter carboniphilus]MBB6216062.1 rubrerythrin [Anaerosolibacter carboniphilus]